MFIAPVVPVARVENGCELPHVPALHEMQPEVVFVGPQCQLSSDMLVKGRLYHIAHGCLVLYRRLDLERRQILDVLGPGRMIGHSLASRMDCAISSFAATRLAPLEASARDTSKLASESEEILLSRMLGHLTRLGRMSAGERVAEAVLDLGRQFGSDNGQSSRKAFQLHLSRGDLADWLGLTLETVSRCLNRLKQERIIDFGREPTMMIRNHEVLRRVASGQIKLDAIYSSKQDRQRASRQKPRVMLDVEQLGRLNS